MIKFSHFFHYFQVVYESYGFLEKNRDKLPDGGMELMRTSSVGLAQLIFLGQFLSAAATNYQYKIIVTCVFVS